MHHAVGDERVILAVVKDREVEHLRVFAGAAHEVVVLHTMAVVGDGDNAGFFQSADGSKFFARDVLGDRAGDEDIHDALFLRTFVDEGNGSGIVNRRRSVRHAHDGGEPTARGSSGSGREVFLRGLAGFSEVDMQINQTGGDNFSLCVKTLHAGGRGKV